MLKVKNIRRFREYLIDFKDLPGRESDFIGYSYPKGSDGKAVEHRGFFNVYHQESKIDNKLSTILDMAQDSQAIFEFVQNAVDCNSTAFYMYYENGFLLAINNGESFKFENVNSILGLAQSTKTINEENIGKFGVGFKLIHRLVGESNGLEELTKDYSGPLLFSWHNRQQLDSLLSFSVDNEIQFDSEGEFWHNTESPWFFKILLTCMPVLPYPHDPLKDLDYELRNTVEGSAFSRSEFENFLTFIKYTWSNHQIDFANQDLNQGSIFFLKLGKNKENKLDEDFKYFQEGIQYALAFMEQMSTKKGLKRIYFNDHKPIEKDHINLQIEPVFSVKVGSAEHQEIKPKLRETEKLHDIQFIFAYQKYEPEVSATYMDLKKSPNFYKYFPMGKEIWGLNFILHSNVFSIETSRREFVRDPLNELLFNQFTKMFCERLEKYIQEDINTYYQIFLALFTSDDPVIKNEGRWISDRVFDPLCDFIRHHTPALEGGVCEMERVVIKATKLNISLSKFNIDKKWFNWVPDERNTKIIDQASEWKIKQWNLICLVEEIKESFFPGFFNDLLKDQQQTFLTELEENWHPDIHQDSFWLKISSIEEVADLVLKSDSKVIKQKYLDAFKLHKIDIAKLLVGDEFICKILRIAASIIETKDEISNFQNKIIIVEGENEYSLKDVNTNNIVTFTINDKDFEVKLSDILPKEYGNSGLVERVIEKLTSFNIAGQKILGVSSKERKDVIYNQIKAVNKTNTLTPWQFVYCANYSLEKNNDYLNGVKNDVNIGELLDIYFTSTQPFPIVYSKYIAGYESERKVYPSDYAHESEKLNSAIIDWLNAGGSESIAQRIEFFEKYGLVTIRSNKLKFRIAFLNKEIGDINVQSIKETQDLFFLQNTINLLKEKRTEYDFEWRDILQKFCQHIFYCSDKASLFMPYVQIKNVNEEQVITYDLLGTRNIYNTLINIDDIEKLSTKEVSLFSILKVVQSSGYQLIDAGFWPGNIKLTGINFTISQHVDDVKLKSEAVRYDFPEWETRTGHYIRIIRQEVPQCYKFKGAIVKEFLDGCIHYDKDSNTIYLKIQNELKDEALYNAIYKGLEQNLETKQHHLLDQFRQLNPFKNSLVARSRVNVIKEQLLNGEFKIYDYEWFYKMFLWEFEAQNEIIKGKRLKFSSIVFQDNNTLMLTDYEFDTIPYYVEFISEKIDIKLYGKHQIYAISAQIKGFNEFEIYFDILDTYRSTLKGLIPFTGLKAVLLLPPENLLFESLKTELFDKKLFPENQSLREHIIKKFNSDYIEFVFGPPGTSKTSTLALRTLVTLADCIKNQTDCRILLLTPTNRAADVIIERMIDLIRCSDTEANSYLTPLSEDEIALFWYIRNQGASIKRWIKRYGKTLSNRLINQELFITNLNNDYETRVISTTIHRLSYDSVLRNWLGSTRKISESIENKNYTLIRKIVLDESSMISLPHCVYSLLQFGNDECLTLYGLRSPVTIGGDPFQLLPVGKTPSYIEVGLEGLSGWATENVYTLLELNNFDMDITPYGGYHITKLMTQYRSNPEIGKFFSAYKYNNKLLHYREGASTIKFTKSSLTDVTVIHYDVKAENVDESPFHKIYVYEEYSVYIIYPTIISIYYAKQIVKAFPEKTVSIICPYGTQTRLVREIVNKEPEFEDVDINVCTIHGYQGNESDIVIFLMVPPKINPYQFSHFNNPNLINVGISRAKENLIVLAPNPDLMKGTYEFNTFLEQYCAKMESSIGIYNYEDKNETLQKRTAINHFNDFNVINVEDAMNEDVKYVFYCGNGRVNVLVNMPDIQEIKKLILKEIEPIKTQMDSAPKRKSLEVGDPVKGEVIGIHKNQKTAFIKISSNQKCVIHINNVAKRFINEIGDELKIGQIIEGRIKNIDPKRGIEMTLLNN